MPKLPHIRTILFDFDETLVPDEANVAQALVTVINTLRDREFFRPADVAQALRNHAQRLWQASRYYPHLNGLGVSSDEGLWARFAGDDPQMVEIRGWITNAYRPAVWDGLLDALELTERELAPQLDAAFQAERRSLGRLPYPEVPAVLDALAGRFKLALVTNGLSDLQREKVATSGLGPRFGAIIVSGEVGHGKPEPQAFFAALDALSETAEGAIMVGDSLERDVKGAHAAGIPVVWVNRDGATAPPDATPDYEVTDLNGLLELLA